MTGLAAFLVAALMLVPALVIAIPLHELGHAVAAYFLGDRSVRYFGYFDLSPSKVRRLFDPLGLLAVFIALVGWGRKIPVQPNRIATMRQKVLYELGGPAANLLVGGPVRRHPSLRASRRRRAVGGVAVGPAHLRALRDLVPQRLDLRLPAPSRPRARRLGHRRGPVQESQPTFLLQRVDQAPADLDRRDRRHLHRQRVQGAVLNLVMSPFYTPASLISLGTCVGYGVPNFNALRPCLL